MSKLDDITEKIESLLSDEESMNQIKELAAMLSGGMNGADPQPGNNAADFPLPAMRTIPEIPEIPAETSSAA